MTGSGRKKMKPRTALEVVVATENSRRGLTYRTLSEACTEAGYEITGAALYMRVTREIPTTGTVDVVAKGLGIPSDTLLTKFREEVKDAREHGRVLAGDGRIKGDFSLA